MRTPTDMEQCFSTDGSWKISNGSWNNFFSTLNGLIHSNKSTKLLLWVVEFFFQIHGSRRNLGWEPHPTSPIILLFLGSRRFFIMTSYPRKMLPKKWSSKLTQKVTRFLGLQSTNFIMIIGLRTGYFFSVHSTWMVAFPRNAPFSQEQGKNWSTTAVFYFQFSLYYSFNCNYYIRFYRKIFKLKQICQC